MLVAGALMPLAFAPFDIFFIAFLCPALLILACSKCSPNRALGRAYSFALGMFGTGVYWLYISINMFGGTTLVLAILATALLVSFLALYPALAAYAARRWFSANDSVFVLIAFPALWVLAEWVRSWFLSGFPWLNLGYSQLDSPLAGFGPLLGVYGMSWCCLLLAGLLVLFYRNRGSKRLAMLLALALLMIVGTSLRGVDWTRQLDESVTAALIQSAIPQEKKWLPEMRQPSLEQYMALSAPHWNDDLVIWPETAIPAYPESVAGFVDKLAALTRSHDTVFFSGIPSSDDDSPAYYNSVMMLADGEISWYHKRHLVPFGEYLPLRSLLGGLFDFLKIPMSNFSAGAQARPLLTTAKFAAGMSICYEDTFGEEVIEALPEAGLLINVSNDAWFGDSLAPHQHLQMARLRALENGRYMLRATNTGISAIIDEKGRIRQRSTQFEPAVLAGRIPLFSGSTPYAGWGNYPVVLLALGLLLFFRYRAKTTS